MRKDFAKSSHGSLLSASGLSEKLAACFVGLLILAVPSAASANDMTIKKVTVGGIGTFGFTVTTGQSPPPPFTQTTVAENTPSPGFTFVAGNADSTYTFTETMPSSGWTLIQVSCPAGWTVSGLDPSGKVSIFHPGGTTGTCTFFNKFGKDKTTETIRNFLDRRVDLLASDEPDRARLQRRFDRPQQPTGSLKDEPPMKLGSAESGTGRLSFSTSLRQIAQANSESKVTAARPDGQMNLGARSGTIVTPSYPQVPGVDVWVEGHYQRWEDDLGGGDRSGNFGILYLGADYLANPWILVGALVQVDWMDDESKKLNTDVSGNGWMAGPYMSLKLSEHILFDARGAWGQSNNEVSPLGTYRDSFDTDRWLAKANVTGNWFVERLRVSPSVGVIYVEETQDSYVDSLGSTVVSQSVHIGRLMFGPEFGYAIQRPDGTIVEPHVAFTGMWDFDKDSSTTVGGLTTSIDDFRVKVEGGLMVRATKGMSGRAALSYDGIGSDDLTAWGGQLWLNVPWD